MKKGINIKRNDSVCCYAASELLELFKDHSPEFLKSLSRDELIQLDHVLDFENYMFLVINYETVIVSVDNEITGIYSIDKFSELTKRLIEAE